VRLRRLTPRQQGRLLILLGLALAAALLAGPGLAGRTDREGLGCGIRLSGLVQRPGLYLFNRPPSLAEALARAGGPRPSESLARERISGLWLEVGAGGILRRDLPNPERLLLGLPLDLNSASAEDLSLLPGLGPRLSRAIVELRTGRGRFGRLEELLEVPGLGPGTLTELKPLLCLSPPATS